MSLSVHRIAQALHLGDGKHEAFQDGFVSDADFKKLGAEPGHIFTYRQGGVVRTYQILRNRTAATLNIGDVMKLYAGAGARIGAVTASTAAVTTTDDTFVLNDLAGGLVFTVGGTGLGQVRTILKNSAAAGASTVTIAEYDRSLNLAATASPDIWDTTPDVTTTYSAVCPWEVTRTTAATDQAMAVAIAPVPQDNWGIFQIAGPALVRCIGNVAGKGLVLGFGITPHATAGAAVGVTSAGITGPEAAAQFGIALDAYTAAGPGLRHVVINTLRFNPYAPVSGG
jgi:hypothetical protein